MDHIARHLMDLYGMGPHTPMALQFPRLPPGPGNPHMPRPQRMHEIIPQLRLEDHTRMLQEYAAGLLTMASPGVIPPGHPLYNKRGSIETLQTENSKLRKENADLKKRLETVQGTRTA